MTYPWYEVMKESDEVRQGDFIPNCPILLPPTELIIDDTADRIDFHDQITVKIQNTVVLSQSCDLEQEKIDIVLVCPLYALDIFLEMVPESDRTGKGREKLLKSLKQGNIPGYHVLNRDTELLGQFQVVDFKNVYGVNLQFLKILTSKIDNRLRLLPPYREHLSQAFARFFMRVGLPNEISDLI